MEAFGGYACRAGTATAYSFGSSGSNLGGYAWYIINCGSKTHPVAQKKPNAFGLYDMHGNVYEWCSDWYEESIILAVQVKTRRVWRVPTRARPVFSAAAPGAMTRGSVALPFASIARLHER